VRTVTVSVGATKRRYKVTTDSKHALPVSDTLLKRHFTPVAPNQVWTADIT
jgi:putative transposase